MVLGGATQVGQFGEMQWLWHSTQRPSCTDVTVLRLAIQFAKLSGFNPIIVTASPHNAPLLKTYGATHVIDRKLPQERILAEVRAIAGDLVDLVYDGVTDDSTVALATVAVKDGGQVVFVLPLQEEILKGAFEPRGVQWVIAEGLQSFEVNKGALVGLWRKLPELLKEKILRVREALICNIVSMLTQMLYVVADEVRATRGLGSCARWPTAFEAQRSQRSQACSSPSRHPVVEHSASVSDRHLNSNVCGLYLACLQVCK